VFALQGIQVPPGGQVVRGAGERAIKDGAEAVQSAVSSFLGTINFIRDDLDSAAVSLT